MIKKLYNKLILFFAFFVMVSLNAQDKEGYVLKGKITDQFNAPLVGAIIKAGNDSQAYSNLNGEFEISVTKATKLTVALDSYKTQDIVVSNTIQDLAITLQEENVYFEKQDKINIPFGKLEKGRIVGSVSAVDAKEELAKDQRLGIGSATYGKVGGVFGGTNILGIGNAVYVVDGIVRSPDYINLTEVEEVTVLKDALSRVLYGAEADQGVILITTRRGDAKNRNFSLRADYGIQSARNLPNYLNSADYMGVYNQANINDGKLPKYSESDIEAAANGTDPLFHPYTDYYGDTFLNNNVSFYDVNMEASGGNEKTLYFLNMGYSNNEGWLKDLGTKEVSNRLNIRANTNYTITPNLTMNLDVVALFDFYNTPDVFDVNNGVVTSDFWTQAQTNLPNSYPLLIPISSIEDELSYDGANLIDGKYLLGGTSEFPRNTYGDMTRRGEKKISNSYFQVNTGLKWDLNFITEGLSISENITFDFLNTSVENQNKSYAVYQPFINDLDQIAVMQIGLDVPSNQNSVSSAEAGFSRRFGSITTVDYEKDFGNNSINATGLIYLTELSLPNTLQDPKRLNYGIRANYMYKEKYVAEFSGALIGSRKLNKGDRYAFAPTVGLGWLLSNEDFFKNTIKADYFKLRGSIGWLKNDNWNDYYLNQTSYSTGGWFNYSNTTGNNAVRNAELNYNNVASNVGWQKRFEYNIGFEGLFLKKSIYAEASFFHSKAYDLITQMNNSTPDLLGYTITDNNNSFIDLGFDYSVKYNKSFGDDWKLSAGYYSVFGIGRVDKMDEPIYADNAQQRIRTGKSNAAMFGLTADGLYGVADFNTDGTLVAGLPTPTFGAVQPGDIKYVDYNNDGVINDDDQSIIGNSQATTQYSFDVNLSYKNLEFYMLGLGQVGQDRFRNNAYFWTYGEMKYSEAALDAYGPNNLDVNASMPRLSSSKNNNNYRNSTFWIYENNYFTIPTMQLSYNFDGMNGKVFKSIKVFVKGNDLIVVNKNKDISDLRLGLGSRPVSRGGTIGVVTSF